MDALPDWDSLQTLTRTVARGTPSYSTNLYAVQKDVERWSSTGQLRALIADGAVLIVRPDRDFYRVYHVARDAAALAGALTRLPAGRYVADLVGRDPGLDVLCAAYVDGGFVLRTFLRRMYNAPQSAPPLVDDAVVAAPDDAEAVAAFLDRLLDRFSEQLPDIDELRGAAEQYRLLVVWRNDAIAGMLMYDLQGQLVHLRFWHVDPDAHGTGIGGALMRSFLSRCGQAKRIVLWVVGDNSRSIAIYRHYGFEVDGLIDRIMVANKD